MSGRVPGLLLLGLLAGAAALAAPPPPGERSTRDLLQSGVAALDDSNFPRAAARFREALAIDPRLAQAHFGLALAALGEHDRKGTEKALRRCQDLLGPIPEVRYALGVARFSWSDTRGAEEELKAAAAGDRFFVEARVALGITAAVRADLEGAAAALREALRLDGADAPARYQLGAVLARAGDLDGGLQEIAGALRLSPDLLDARPEDPVGLATRSVRSGAPESRSLEMPLPVIRPSVAWPRRRPGPGATGTVPEVPEWYLYYEMALTLADASKWRGAADMLERALALKDRSEIQAIVADRLVDYSPHLRLAEAYHRLGNFREAFLHLGIAKSEGNTRPEALRALEILIQKDRQRPTIVLDPLPDRTSDETVTVRGLVLSEEPVTRVDVGGREALLRPPTNAELTALLPEGSPPVPREATQNVHFEVPGYRLAGLGANPIRIRPVFKDPARDGDLLEVMVVRLPRPVKGGPPRDAEESKTP
ncbi:MAG TPA: hypothetical protein VFT43_04255 [Candidatus Polarisedimenticolia bacterium]|nr:hypothetical protein [Candidatus Polarisedimenticolia bacterium]